MIFIILFLELFGHFHFWPLSVIWHLVLEILANQKDNPLWSFWVIFEFLAQCSHRRAILAEAMSWAVRACLSPFRIPASLITPWIQWWARGMEILGEMKYWRLINPPEKRKFSWWKMEAISILQRPSNTLSWISTKMILARLPYVRRTYPRFFILIKMRQAYIITKKWTQAHSLCPLYHKKHKTARSFNWISGIFMSKNDHLL